MAYFMLVIGFALLIKGADFFVDGASGIAHLMRISPLLVGLTIVAFGTSAPEATVSIIAAINNSSDISIGNIVGSNILNTSLIVGVAAFLYPLKVERQTIKKEIPFTLLSGGVLLILMSDMVLRGFSNQIDRSDGLIMLVFLSIFLYYVFEVAKNNRETNHRDAMPGQETWGKSFMLIIGGLIGILIGGNMVVNHATTIAYDIGMSEALVGLTVVAIGTSLPELVTSIAAAMKKQSEIALGNIVGSNIFNILFVLGVTSTISPLDVNGKVFTDVFVMLALTVVLLIFSRTNFKIGKMEGFALVFVYIVYVIYIIMRN